MEDPRSQLDGVLVKVVGSSYGPRDSPMIWQDRLRFQMKLLGFKESLRVPCLFFHGTKGVEVIAEVDDLFVVGCLNDVKHVCHGLRLKLNAHMLDKRRETVKFSNWGRRTVFVENGLEIHGDIRRMQPFQETRMDMCKSLCSLHVADAKLPDIVCR